MSVKEPTDVIVSIRSKTIDLLNGGENAEAEAEEIEYSAPGTMSERDGVVCVEYDEPAGLGMGACRTSLRFEAERPGLLTLSRSGGSTAGLTFDSGARRQNCALNVAGAGIEFCICTRRFVNGIDAERGGTVELDYLIEFHGVLTERTILTVNVSTGEVHK